MAGIAHAIANVTSAVKSSQLEDVSPIRSLLWNVLSKSHRIPTRKAGMAINAARHRSAALIMGRART
jgi:hypothetical protein